MVKPRVYLNPTNKTLVIDGQEYRAKREVIKKINGVEHVDYVIFSEVTEVDRKKANKIKDVLSKQLEGKKIANEVVNSMDLSTVKRI